MIIIRDFLGWEVVLFCILSGFLEAYCGHSLFSEGLGLKIKDEHTQESLSLCFLFESHKMK